MMALPHVLLMFAAALALLVLGHLMRVARWLILLRPTGPAWPSAGFFALSLAYAINVFLPFRLGEVARAFYYASRVRVDVAYVVATIVVERTLDLVVVWLLLTVLSATDVGGSGVWVGAAEFWAGTAATLGVGLGVFAAAALTSRSGRFRRVIWALTAVFNARVQLVLLDTIWSVVEVARALRSTWAPVAVRSVLMWGLYLASYRLLAGALDIGFPRLLDALVGAPLTPLIVPLLSQGGDKVAWLVAYGFVPFALVSAYALLRDRFGLDVRGGVRWVSDPLVYLGSLPRSKARFVEAEHYAGFLVRRFSGTSDLVSDFELNAIGDIVVQRMLRGGSDALTVMVQVADTLRIRKYAVGAAALKLEAQCVWLQAHALALPLVPVIQSSRTGERFLYDMEYSKYSRDLFDTIHTYDIRSSWIILSDMLETMTDFYERTADGVGDSECVGHYVTEKVQRNLHVIRKAVPGFFDRRCVQINGTAIDLAMVERFADADFITARLRQRGLATIHGDLTIENVMTDQSRPNGWFLIDPNIGNIFESPLLDYGKVLQSLHLGYESLNRNISCAVDEREITFPIARTAQYATLYSQTTDWLRGRHSEETMREIRLHEIIHYFRLTPYKFRKGVKPGIVFFGCLCLLINRYVQDFE